LKSKLAKSFTSRAEQSWSELDSTVNISSKSTRDAKKDETIEQERKSSSKLKNKITEDKPAKSPKKRAPDEPVVDDNYATENKVKHDKQNSFTAPSQLSLSSAFTKSAIKRKGLKGSKGTSNVRFDATADRPKLDIVMSGVQKQSKINKLPLSISSTQTSGISSCESGGRRRKKASNGGKSKASILAMKGFEDDGGFL
jgi:hypothetical protein